MLIIAVHFPGVNGQCECRVLRAQPAERLEKPGWITVTVFLDASHVESDPQIAMRVDESVGLSKFRLGVRSKAEDRALKPNRDAGRGHVGLREAALYVSHGVLDRDGTAVIVAYVTDSE